MNPRILDVATHAGCHEWGRLSSVLPRQQTANNRQKCDRGIAATVAVGRLIDVFVPRAVPEKRLEWLAQLVGSVAGGCQIEHARDAGINSGTGVFHTISIGCVDARLPALLAALRAFVRAESLTLLVVIDGHVVLFRPDDTSPPLPPASRPAWSHGAVSAQVVVPLTQDPVAGDGQPHRAATWHQIETLVCSVAADGLVEICDVDGVWHGLHEACRRYRFELNAACVDDLAAAARDVGQLAAQRCVCFAVGGTCYLVDVDVLVGSTS